MRINKDQICISRWDDIKFSYKRGHGHLLPYLVNRFKWHCFPRLHYLGNFPPHLDIEISSKCNMACPMCFTVTEEFSKKQQKGFMSFDLFKKIIDEAARHKIYSIRISHRGEAFMHPEVVEFVSYAKKSGIKEVSSLSNILSLSPPLFRRILEAGLDWLTISFDGIGETYEYIRKPAKFQESYEKIKEYKSIKDNYRSRKPVIKIQSIWPAIKDCTEEYIELFKPYVDTISSNPLIDYLHKDNPNQIEYWENFDCPTPYQRLTVLFNGLVPYCHNDEFCTHILGDVNSDDVYDIWHGEKMRDVRQSHRARKAVFCLDACKRCFLPRKVKPVLSEIRGRDVIIEEYVNRPQKIGE